MTGVDWLCLALCGVAVAGAPLCFGVHRAWRHKIRAREIREARLLCPRKW